jgi:hypothetical protein
MTWDRFLINSGFRSGKKHSNSGKTAEEMVRHVVALIRKLYGDIKAYAARALASAWSSYRTWLRQTGASMAGSDAPANGLR